MFAFAVLHRPAGLGPAMEAALTAAHEDGWLDGQMVFPIEQRLVWVDDRRTTALLGWWSGLDGYGSGLPWFVDESGVTAFVGHLWPRGRGWPAPTPWAEQLHGRLDHNNGVGVDLGLSGVYGLVHFDRTGAGIVSNDPLGITLLYEGTGPDGLTVHANRASLGAALVAGVDRRPPRDPIGVGWLAYSGVVLDERTGYADVHVLPAGTDVVFGERGVRRRERASPTTWRRDEVMEPGYAAAVIRGALEGEMAVMAELTPTVAVDLTGGKDSRLVLAGLLLTDTARRVTFTTAGAEDSPDVAVAAVLAETFDLDHGRRAAPRAPDSEHWLAASRGDDIEHMHRRYVFSTSGAANLWDSRRLELPAAGVKISGLGGELLRTNYARSSRFRTFDDLPRFLFDGMSMGRAELIRPELRDFYENGVRAVLDECAAGAPTSQDAIDRYYLRVRLRRWMGANHEHSRANRAFPFVHPEMVAASFALDQQTRRSEVVHYLVMRAADERLVAIDFGQTEWAFDLGRYVPGIPVRPDPTPPLPPPRPPHRGGRRRVRPRGRKVTAAREKRAQRQQEEAELMARYLLDGSDNPLFDVVDRKALAARVAEYDDLSTPLRHQVMGALGAAIWLAGDELEMFSGGSSR